MSNLKQYLQDQGVESELAEIVLGLAKMVKRIAAAIKVDKGGKTGTENVFGEEQIALDVLSNDIMLEEMKKIPAVGLLASEEMENEEKIGEGRYAVCADPLDGSSLADVNLTVGTIVGIYQLESFVGAKGDDQLAALVAVYGPRTTMLLTVKKGVVEFLLNEEGEFVLTKMNLQIGEGKMFAPGNLRATKFHKDYLELVNYWCREQYTLRYSGGMVPDVNQIILKGMGVFTYPGYDDAPEGKLRLLYECAPIALLVEEAGGMATDGKVRILEKVVENLQQRTPILLGSKGEVRIAEKYLSG